MQPSQSSQNFNLVIAVSAQTLSYLLFCSHRPSYLRRLAAHPWTPTHLSGPGSDHTSSGRMSLISPLNSSLACLSHHTFGILFISLSVLIHVCYWTSGINFLSHSPVREKTEEQLKAQHEPSARSCTAQEDPLTQGLVWRVSFNTTLQEPGDTRCNKVQNDPSALNNTKNGQHISNVFSSDRRQ